MMYTHICLYEKDWGRGWNPHHFSGNLCVLCHFKLSLWRRLVFSMCVRYADVIFINWLLCNVIWAQRKCYINKTCIQAAYIYHSQTIKMSCGLCIKFINPHRQKGQITDDNNTFCIFFMWKSLEGVGVGIGNNMVCWRQHLVGLTSLNSGTIYGSLRGLLTSACVFVLAHPPVGAIIRYSNSRHF